MGVVSSRRETNNMRNMSLGITAFVVSVGIVSVSAQGRSFSGTWVIDSEKTMAAAQSSGEPGTRAIAGSGGEGRIVASGGTGGAAAGGVAEARTRSGSGGGGAATAGGGGRVIAAPAAGGSGGRVGAVVSTDTVITMDANNFITDIGGVRTSYPLNGSEVAVQLRNSEGRARASWKGDTLVIETTLETPTGPLVSTTSWYLEGDSLVRLTNRKTYYKRK
jgi:hypothetical protein